ncbi:MAG: hypothetical protein V1736_00495, partial [Pseudomonadota bacterium]
MASNRGRKISNIRWIRPGKCNCRSSATIVREIQKRTRKLKELQLRLAHPPKRGKPVKAESAQKQAQAILVG